MPNPREKRGVIGNRFKGEPQHLKALCAQPVLHFPGLMLAIMLKRNENAYSTPNRSSKKDQRQVN